MKNYMTLLVAGLFISGCAAQQQLAEQSLQSVPSMAYQDRHMAKVTQLTSEGDNGEAYFSTDGTKLVFQSNRGGFECDKIWVMNVDGSGKHMVSPDHGAHTCSFFFPDGERIVFSSTSHLPGTCPPKTEIGLSAGHYMWSLYPYDIFSANADGGNMQKLTDNPGYDAEPVVSADGGKIVFGSQREGDFNIYIMDADGSNQRRLTNLIGYDGGPWFSPDGNRIVWRAWHPKNKEERAKWRDCMEKNYIVPFPLDIWVMNADGSGKHRLTDNGAVNWAPSWHPDGKRIIFSSNMDDWREDLKTYGHNFELYLINSDGTGLERITYNNVFDSFPMFSPDGKKLVFASNRNPQKPRATDIFIAEWTD